MCLKFRQGKTQPLNEDGTKRVIGSRVNSPEYLRSFLKQLRFGAHGQRLRAPESIGKDARDHAVMKDGLGSIHSWSRRSDRSSQYPACPQAFHASTFFRWLTAVPMLHVGT